MGNTKLIHITPDAEKVIAYCARVSSPNQENENISGLLKFCIRHKHWSIFEMASLCVEVTTSRAVSQQIIRHKSLKTQEFSQRYSEVQGFEKYKARRQDLKNRQNSIDDMSDEDNLWFDNAQDEIQALASSKYKEGLSRNIAKEQMRFLLPLSTQTKLYMHGDIRSFIHYLEVRTNVSTQLEHRNVANDIKAIFIEQLPIISEALGWK